MIKERITHAKKRIDINLITIRKNYTSFFLFFLAPQPGKKWTSEQLAVTLGYRVVTEFIELDEIPINSTNKQPVVIILEEFQDTQRETQELVLRKMEDIEKNKGKYLVCDFIERTRSLLDILCNNLHHR